MIVVKDLIIIGAGGHGYVVYDVAKHLDYGQIFFLDDNAQNEYVMGSCSKVYTLNPSQYDVFIALGNSKLREQWIIKLQELGFNIPVIISKNAYIAEFVDIGFGTIICPGATVNANCKIMEGCIISANSVIDHNTIINKYCHINCGAIVRSYQNIMEHTKVDYKEVV